MATPTSWAIPTTDACHLSFSENQTRRLLLTYGVVGIIAAATCLVGILLVCVLKLCKHYVYRLAMYQVIAALLFGLARSLQLLLFDFDELSQSGLYHSLCDAVAYFTVCSSWIKLVFVVWVTIHLFLYTVFLKNFKKLELLSVVSAVVIGPIIAAIPLITHSYGRAGPWCWIKGHQNICTTVKFLKGEIEELSVWYGPAFLVLLVNSIFVIATISVMIFRVRKMKPKPIVEQLQKEQVPLLPQPKEDKYKKALLLMLPLLAYPLLFCLLIVIPLLNRLYEMVEHQSDYGFFLASAIAIPGTSCLAGVALITHVLILEWQTLMQSVCNKLSIRKKHGQKHHLACHCLHHQAAVDKDDGALNRSGDDEHDGRRQAAATSTTRLVINESEVEPQRLIPNATNDGVLEEPDDQCSNCGGQRQVTTASSTRSLIVRESEIERELYYGDAFN